MKASIESNVHLSRKLFRARIERLVLIPKPRVPFQNPLSRIQKVSCKCPQERPTMNF